MIDVGGAGQLSGRVHCQLWRANIHCCYAELGCSNRANRGTAGQVISMYVDLSGDVRRGASHNKARLAWGITGVALIGVSFDYIKA